MDITGTITQSLPEQSGTSQAGKPWKKKEYILETIDTNFPKKVCFNFFGEKVDQFPLEIGKQYTVSIDIESREYNGRWYTNVNAFKAVPAILTAPSAAPAPQQPQPYGQAPVQQTTTAQPAMAPQSSDDELPF